MAVWTAAGSVRTNRLLVSGVDYIPHVPLDIAPITWTDIAGESWGNLSFTVLDTAATRNMQGGSDVQLTVNGTRVFGGTLVRRSYGRMPGAGRVIECEAVSYDSWLDWRIVPRWSSRTDLGNRVRKLTSDRAMVKDLVERRGGPLLAPNSTVTQTNASMDVVRVQRKTLREALELVAAEAQSTASPGKRRFYVDEQRRVHWYSGLEGTAAPYRIADGSYVRDVLTTAGLVEYWSLREEGGTVNFGALGVADMALTGGFVQAQTGGAVNEPAYRALYVNGTGAATKTSAHASLFPGDTFSLECWFQRTSLGTVQDFIVATGGGDDSYHLRFTAGNLIELLQRTTGRDFITTAAIADSSWHHLAVAHSPSSTIVYVDGASVAGTTTAKVFGTDATVFGVGGSANGFIGRVQHVAVYSSKLSAATALAHYRQGISIPPDSLTLDDDWAEVLHHAYVVGKNSAGSGWVYNSGSDFERGAIQDFVERERADTNAERARAGRSAIRSRSRIRGLTFQTDVAAAWRSGQKLTVTDDSFGLSGDTFEIRAVNGELDQGGATFDIEAGALRRRLTRRRRR